MRAKSLCTIGHDLRVRWRSSEARGSDHRILPTSGNLVVPHELLLVGPESIKSRWSRMQQCASILPDASRDAFPLWVRPGVPPWGAGRGTGAAESPRDFGEKNMPAVLSNRPGGPHPRGAWPLEESLFATHIEPAEHAPLALGGIEISLLPSPFGLPPGIRTTAMQTVELCDLGARVDGFVGRPCPSRGGQRGLARSLVHRPMCVSNREHRP
jgi:hypothetical protein